MALTNINQQEDKPKNSSVLENAAKVFGIGVSLASAGSSAKDAFINTPEKNDLAQQTLDLMKLKK